MPSFPPLLPNPRQDYSAGVDPFLSVNEFETNIRQRNRFTNPLETVQVSWMFTQLQFDIFKAFVAHVLINGSAPFDLDIIGLDGLQSRNVVLRGGTYSSKLQGFKNYIVSATLQIQQPALMDYNTLEILGMDAFSNPDLFNISAEALFTYIEETFGDSSGNPITSNFINTYA